MALPDILRGLRPTPGSYLAAARAIEADDHSGLMTVNVAFLSTFTADLLRPYLVAEGAARGLLVKPYFAPFNQLEQQVLDSASPFYEFGPEIVVIATRIEDFVPDLVNHFVGLRPAEVDEQLALVEDRLSTLIEGVRRFSSAAVLVLNYAGPEFPAAGLADTSLEPSQATVMQRANRLVAEVCRRFSGVYVFDYARMVFEFGQRRWYDPKLWYLARVPFGALAQVELSQRLARYLRALCLPACKCLVVDADNTLWGGVVGEEGFGGIALGEEYPGNVYKDFQRTLRSLRDRGVMLALASKNNERDVLEVFEKHSDCVLKTEDFSALQVHWEDKATSLAAIAEELNIGAGALAFFDDNPVERDWVRSQMPEVTVIDVPDSPLEFARALNESGAFDVLTVSTEDRKRGEMHQQQKERKQLEAHSLSLDEFLQRLEMTATVGQVSPETLPRVAQLLAKTNQFNLTTRRHTSAGLEAMIQSGAVALWLRVADRFGDNGLVAVAIAVPGSSGRWTIDSFIMSCRVFGRRIETALLSVLCKTVRGRGGQVLLGEYIPTVKNGIACEFYPAHGFKPVDIQPGVWQSSLVDSDISIPEVVKVRFEDDTTLGG